MSPTGIIMQSGSIGATAEAIEKVLAANGHEPDKPEPAAEPVEPKRDDFANDEEFEAAQEAFEIEQEERQTQETDEQREERERKEQAAAARKPTRKQRAIDKATRELREQNKKLEERLAALEGKAAPEPKIEAPKRENFKSDAEFEEAMFHHRYKLQRAKDAAEEAQQRVKAQLKENFENYQSSVVEFKEEHDDWDEVVNQSLPIHDSVYLAVMELENGPAVTYYLGKHPDYARRLAEMTPLSAAMEVGRLSTRLKTGAPEPGAARSGAQPRPRTRLPEPVKPVSTAATSSTLTSREAAKNRNYKGFKQAQRAGR